MPARAMAACAAALLFAAAPSGEAADLRLEDLEGFSVGTGLHYSTGDYGTGIDTEIVSVPLLVRYERERLLLRLSVPWLEVSGASSVIPGAGSVSGNGRGRGRGGAGTVTGGTSASGLGDTVASATYTLFYDSASRSGLDVGARVKLPTADEEEGLGTGETDYGLQADVYRTIERTTWFGGLGYTVIGDSSRFALRDDAWGLNAGASYRIDGRDSAGLSFDWRQPYSRGASHLSEITAFWVRNFDRRWKGQAYFLKGLADGSPDWGLGAFAYYAF